MCGRSYEAIQREFESEISGKIVKVLAEDATVEYDQPLFLVDPSLI